MAEHETELLDLEEFREHIVALALDFEAAETDQELYELASHMIMDLIGFVQAVQELYEALDEEDTSGFTFERVQA